MKRLIVAMTGASGALYGVRLLEQLRATAGVETHLMISDAAALNLHHELDIKRRDIEALASHVHSVRDIGACVASGSFRSDGMVIAPCSMKLPMTLRAVQHRLLSSRRLIMSSQKFRASPLKNSPAPSRC